MVSDLGELELRVIEQLTRAQLLEALEALRNTLPNDLLNGLAQAPNDYLRLLLLAARLIHVLRHARDLQ